MSTESCPDPVRELLTEAALGLLAEPERSEVLAHAERCPSCGRALGELVQVGDRLVGLAPEAEPPPGFEQRVLARAAAGSHRRPRRRPWIAAIAAVSLVVAGVVGWLVFAPDEDRPAGLEQAALRTADGDAVGRLLVGGDVDRAVVLRLDRYREGVAYTCQLVLDDGAVVDVGRWTVHPGREPAWWAGTVETSAPIVEARILGPGGTVWARGEVG